MSSNSEGLPLGPRAIEESFKGLIEGETFRRADIIWELLSGLSKEWMISVIKNKTTFKDYDKAYAYVTLDEAGRLELININTSFIAQRLLYLIENDETYLGRNFKLLLKALRTLSSWKAFLGIFAYFFFSHELYHFRFNAFGYEEVLVKFLLDEVGFECEEEVRAFSRNIVNFFHDTLSNAAALYDTYILSLIAKELNYEQTELVTRFLRDFVEGNLVTLAILKKNKFEEVVNALGQSDKLHEERNRYLYCVNKWISRGIIDPEDLITALWKGDLFEGMNKVMVEIVKAFGRDPCNICEVRDYPPSSDSVRSIITKFVKEHGTMEGALRSYSIMKAYLNKPRFDLNRALKYLKSIDFVSYPFRPSRRLYAIRSSAGDVYLYGNILRGERWIVLVTDIPPEEDEGSGFFYSFMSQVGEEFYNLVDEDLRTAYAVSLYDDKEAWKEALKLIESGLNLLIVADGDLFFKKYKIDPIIRSFVKAFERNRGKGILITNKTSIKKPLIKGIKCFVYEAIPGIKGYLVPC
ncbi:hypothetical protein IPA_06610 [Ignicoccus pacificus DSM 13166]|uniref:Uncharacterized protein n=1 Tax=Ignicoccus pacificus DSM 13166 TaxID=940294 RepID=A0A977KCR5_9CREN|nr:hypothetical protein IPA_06610 [Ignicoccus pacificus DSM 13166]